MFKIFFATLISILAFPHAHAAETKFNSWSDACTAAAEVVAIGDLIFLDIPNTIFRHVAIGTGSWTSHVGLVFKGENGEWVVKEKFGASIEGGSPLQIPADFIGASVRGKTFEPAPRSVRDFNDEIDGRRNASSVL